MTTESAIPYLCGWRPNPQGVNRSLNDPDNRHPVFMVSARPLIEADKQDSHLWIPFIALNPTWRRKAQAIGDCVSWGAAFACDMLVAKAFAKLRRKSMLQTATEPIYGGSRVEAVGRNRGGWSDGSYGSAAADWVRKYGVLLRKDYSTETGNPAHDIRSYSGDRARNWGNYGCGGKNDKGKLDKVARKHPVKTTSQVNNFEDVAAAIAVAKCPVTIASDYGCSMRRNKYGECRWSGSWGHQMMLAAVRFGKRPAALCVQSWGPNVASGPSGDEYTENLPPGGTPEAILGCSWWIPAEDVTKICRQGDSFAFSQVEGWKPDRADWSKMWGDNYL